MCCRPPGATVDAMAAPPRRRPRRHGLLWGSAFAAIRAALEHFSAGHLSVLRLLVAAVALGAVGAARGVRLPAAPRRARDRRASASPA